MSTLATLGAWVQERLEETVGAPGTFWSLTGEIYPVLVEAQREAALITGEPEVRLAAPITLAANTTVFSVPVGAIALLRLQAPQWVPKTTVWDLDRMVPGWQSDAGTAIDAWFPVGLTQFGIHPQLTAPVQAFLSYIALPVPTGRPYTGSEAIDFQSEYLDAFADYASHVLIMKESGEEFKQSAKLYDRFLAKMSALSNFSYRKNALRFTRTVGASEQKINPIEKR